MTPGMTESPSKDASALPTRLVKVCVELLANLMSSTTRDEVDQRAAVLRQALRRLLQAGESPVRYWLHRAESVLRQGGNEGGPVREVTRKALRERVVELQRATAAAREQKERERRAELCLRYWSVLEALGVRTISPKDLIGTAGLGTESDVSDCLARLQAVGLVEVVGPEESPLASLTIQALCLLRNPVQVSPTDLVEDPRAAHDESVPEVRLAAGFGGKRAQLRAFYETPALTANFVQDFDLVTFSSKSTK